MSISIQTNIQNVIDGLEKEKELSKTVIKRTLSDARTRGPGWVSGAVREEYNISAKDIKEAYKGIQSAGTSAIVGGEKVDDMALVWAGRSLTLSHFGMTPKNPKPASPKNKQIIPSDNLHLKNGGGKKHGAAVAQLPPKYQVKATIKKGKKVTIKDEKGRGTPIFVTSVRGQKPLAFQRVNSDRNRFESIRDLSVPQMIEDGNGNVKPKVQKAFNEGLEKRFENHCKLLEK